MGKGEGFFVKKNGFRLVQRKKRAGIIKDLFGYSCFYTAGLFADQ